MRRESMRVTELSLFTIELPLRREIRHASATRRASKNLLVRCRLEDGTCGWGEGVPREYVTGETPASAVRQFEATPLGEQLGARCESWNDVIQVCDGLQLVVEGADPRSCRANSLRCAIELSLLDACGRVLQQPVSTALTQVTEADRVLRQHANVRYSTTITADAAWAERIAALKMRLYGFCQCKVKVGVPGADDSTRVARIRNWIGSKMDLRVDANEAWHEREAVAQIQALLPYGISCVEQPVPHAEVASLTAVRQEVDVPLMLDESLTSLIDGRRAIDDATCDLFNIRISKCGGLLTAVRLAAMADEAGLGYQLGCHPGESGILSAAGRHFASAVNKVRYLEGSYDRHLLQERLIHEDITFGYGGKAVALTAPGLSVAVDERVVKRLAQLRATQRFDSPSQVRL